MDCLELQDLGVSGGFDLSDELSIGIGGKVVEWLDVSEVIKLRDHLTSVLDEHKKGLED